MPTFTSTKSFRRLNRLKSGHGSVSLSFSELFPVILSTAAEMMELPVGIRLTNNRVVGKVAMCQKQARPSFRITDYLSKWIESLKIEALLPISERQPVHQQFIAGDKPKSQRPESVVLQSDVQSFRFHVLILNSILFGALETGPLR